MSWSQIKYRKGSTGSWGLVRVVQNVQFVPHFCGLNWWDWDIIIIFNSWSLHCKECYVDQFVYVSYYDTSIILWRGFLQEFKSYLKYPCKISSSLTLISSGTHFAGNILYDLNLMYGPELNNNCVSISDV